MKAVVIEHYGPPEEVMKVIELPKPLPKENEVTIRIHATAINDYDWSMISGKPFLYRLMFGLSKPKSQISGMELAGTVEATGSNVSKLKVGDAVCGDISAHGFGTFAEYICIHENAVVRKPDELSFEEAASLPHAALLALQGLRDIGKLKDGERVLINGGGGGVGTIGLQLAKLQNCEVTGVDTGEKLEMMRTIGFDHVLDYRTTNFTKTGERYDLILDCKTSQSGFDYLRALNPSGRYITVGGKLFRILLVAFLGLIIRRFSSKKLQLLGLDSNKGLDHINELAVAGKLNCQIDGPYSMEDIPRLVQYFGDGKHKGKIVVTVN